MAIASNFGGKIRRKLVMCPFKAVALEMKERKEDTSRRRPKRETEREGGREVCSLQQPSVGCGCGRPTGEERLDLGKAEDGKDVNDVTVGALRRRHHTS